MNASPKEMLDQVVVTYSIKYLPCSNPDCLTCLTAKGHGPYWYAHFTLAGEEKKVFLGKAFKPMDLTKILMGERMGAKKTDPIHQEEQARSYEKAQQEEAELGAVNPEQPLDYNSDNPLIDRVGPIPSRQKNKIESSPKLPTEADFEQDLRLLKGAARSENLKYVYRNLIKKYHPDQFGNHPKLHHWMTEINGTYHRLSAR